MATSEAMGKVIEGMGAQRDALGDLCNAARGKGPPLRIHRIVDGPPTTEP